MKYLKLCILLLFSSEMVAQTTLSPRNQAVRALNNYVDYCNATAHYLKVVLPKFDEWNQDFNKRVEKNRQTEEFTYSPQGFLNDPDYYQIITPENGYKKCIAASQILLPAEQKVLNAKLNQLHQTVKNIESLRMDTLKKYVTDKIYLSDFDKGYRILQKAEKLFSEFDNTKESLTSELQKIYNQRFYFPPPAGDYIVSVSKLAKGMQICKNLTDDLGKGDSTRLREFTFQLDSLVEVLKNNKSKYLPGIRDELFENGANNGFNLLVSYDHVISQLNVMLIKCEEFIKKSKHPYATLYPDKCFYYYNQELIQHYNQFGLTHYYNEFVTLITGDKLAVETEFGTRYKGLSGNKYGFNVPVRYMLMWASEAPLFKVYPPKK
jgi:hypothetical protein